MCYVPWTSTVSCVVYHGPVLYHVLCTMDQYCITCCVPWTSFVMCCVPWTSIVSCVVYHEPVLYHVLCTMDQFCHVLCTMDQFCHVLCTMDQYCIMCCVPWTSFVMGGYLSRCSIYNVEHLCCEMQKKVCGISLSYQISIMMTFGCPHH